MFWTASDVFKLRLEQKRYDEAEKILEALKRMLPRVEAINKELDGQNATTQPAPATATVHKLERQYPREKSEAQQEGSSASAFIASATRHLAKVALSGATVVSRGCETPVPASDKQFEPHRGDTSHSNTVLTGLFGEKHHGETTNSQLLHDDPGHMIVSMDEGIIRPLAGVSVPQRVVLACLTAHTGYNVPQISISTGIPHKSVEHHIAALIEKNLIKLDGSKKTGGYYISDRDNL